MRSKTICIGLLLFQAVWLNVIVPGHQRGVVALPGETCAACEVARHSSCDGSLPKRSAAPKSPSPRDPASHCAICHFAAALSPPPVVDLTAPPLGLLEIAELPLGESSDSIPSLPTYDGRAPPADSTLLA